MKNITYRELLNLMYDGKKPKQIKYNERLYKNYKNFDYYDKINKKLLSTVIGENNLLYGMAMYKCITIYDEILDDKEKEYLSNLIKPFKKYVKSITKQNMLGRERIEIRYKDFEDNNFPLQSVIVFPTFRKNSMYKGMELEKDYTLEELGL